MVNLYVGYDPRESVAYHVFCQSVIDTSSVPVKFIPLHREMLQGFDGQRDGTNAFIFSRYLIASLQGFEGWAIFADGDMLFRRDIAQLMALKDERYAVQVVKHGYKTKHPRKYIGTSMESPNEDYPCPNWSSVMLINCQHYGWRHITPSLIETVPGSHLHRFQFLEDRYVGELPAGWNHLADEMGQNDDAKLLHWTAGIPAWAHYKDAPHAVDWFHAHEKVNHAC
jgi:lipopolysaccharide biosynthesis glycosyltransferase